MLSRLFSTSSSGSGSRNGNGLTLRHRPLPRWGHSVANVQGKMYLWGGCQESLPKCHSSVEKEQFLSKVEIFDPQTKIWEEKLTTGPPPLGCYWNAFASQDTNLYAFGGYCGHGKCYHNAIHQMDTTNLQWKELMATNPGNAPMKKWQCGMVTFKNNGEDFLCIFGGWGILNSASGDINYKFIADRANPGCVWSNEIHYFNLTEGKWSWPKTTGSPPPPCQGFTFSKVDAVRVVLFGGFQPESRRRVNEIFILHLLTGHWIRLSSPLDPKVAWPCGRDDHSACVKGGSYPLLVVVGGVGNQFNTLNDLWIFDVDSQNWKQVSAPQSVSGRRGHSTVVFSLGPRHFQLVVCGGISEWLMEKPHREQPMVAETSVLELIDADDHWKIVEDTSSPVHTPNMSRSSSSVSIEVFTPQKVPITPTPVENGFQSTNPLSPNTVGAGLKKNRKKSSKLQVMTMTLDRKAAASKQFQEARKEIHKLQLELEARNKELAKAKKTAEVATQKRQESLKELELLRRQLKQTQFGVKAKGKEVEERSSVPVPMNGRRSSPVGADSVHSSPERKQQSPKKTRASSNGLEQLWLVSKAEIELVSQELYHDHCSVTRVGSFRGLQVTAQSFNRGVVNETTLPHYIQAMNTASLARHPNIVQMVAATLSPDPLVLTEWMPASVKFLLLQKGSIAKEQLISIAKDISSALTFLHSWRPDSIIHRDVSSSNVFLEVAAGGKWRAKLSNYGISKFINHVSLTSGNVTSPKLPSIFAAPEAKAPELHSPKMDTYSYGVLLLEMCQPQEGTSPNAHDIHNRVTSLHWPTMSDLISSCTMLAPDSRPTMYEVSKKLHGVNESFV